MNTSPLTSIDQVLTSGEVAKLCAVNFRTVIRWAEKGLLPAYRLPGRGDYRIKATDLVRFLNDNHMPLPEALMPATRRALVVDDEVAMTAAIERCLKRAGFEVKTAHSGFRAGLVLGSFQPDLVTLDLRMPGLDGFGVLDLIASDAVPRKPRIIVISAEVNTKLELALSRGAQAVLAKPFTNEELIQTIESLFVR